MTQLFFRLATCLSASWRAGRGEKRKYSRGYIVPKAFGIQRSQAEKPACCASGRQGASQNSQILRC